MKTLATVTLVFAATLGAFAAHPPKRQQQRQEKEKANDETKHKIAHYQTDEGVSGTRAWKEYTANPKANGPTTLLVVFGGRDSVSRGAGPGPTVPAAIERALDYARRHSTLGKVIVLVPEMTVERDGGWRRGMEKPSAEGIAKLVRARAEKHGVKPARIFATGFSMGGGLVCSLINDDPTLFTRALVVGASGDAGAVADVRAEVLSYHGADDDLIPVTRVKAYAEALCAKRPGAMKVEVLPKTGHAESEEAAYAKQDAWKWLFR